MKQTIFGVLALVAISLLGLGFIKAPQLAPPPTPPAPGTYSLDKSHSQVLFTVTHMGISSVTGTFKQMDGKVVIGSKGLSSLSTEATIQTASISTQNDGRDNHLRSDDFFNAEKFPTATFKSKSIKVAGNNLTIVGDLTIRDVTKTVTLKGKYLGTVNSKRGDQTITKIAFEASTTIKRLQYGLKWNSLMEAGGLVVSDDVKITLSIQANKQ
ncbi:MAG TPA: YceI family protein [Rhodothermales bacterium]|nr:polyisoprenoid-binding protein [Bacteroidota bacterium]HRK72912.1 YceI family protein [Rhodothermales bacterium]HRR08126.1 YceI family protein [Rhodothermales bacterium]